MNNQDHASQEIREKEKKIQDIRLTIEDSKDLFAEIEAEIEKSVHEREELNRRHKSFLKKREDLSGRMSDLDKEFSVWKAVRKVMKRLLTSRLII